MQLKNKQDFWSGIMFVAIGARIRAWAPPAIQWVRRPEWGPAIFRSGSASSWPCSAQSSRLAPLPKTAEEIALEKFDWKIWHRYRIRSSACGVVLNFLGVYISIFLLVFFSSMASHIFSWKVAAINGTV